MPGDDRVVRWATDAIRAEAGKWRRLSDDMGQLKTQVGELGLSPSAFFFPDVLGATVSVKPHADSYAALHNWLLRLVTDATAEFTQIAGALDKSAQAYENTETRNSVDLQSIYGQNSEGA